MERVLFVGSDHCLAISIRTLVSAMGYEVRTTPSGEIACEMVTDYRAAAVIVDNTVAGATSAVPVCRNLRMQTHSPGIVFLYAFGRDDEALEAFAAGADDCIGKMPSDAEFRARLSAVIRRASWHTKYKVSYDAIELDPLGRFAAVQGNRVELTPTQYRMLDYILRNAGRPVSAGEFRRSIFRAEQAVDSSKLRVHIHELRRRLGSVGRLIKSVRGKGYGVGLDDSPIVEPNKTNSALCVR